MPVRQVQAHEASRHRLREVRRRGHAAKVRRERMGPSSWPRPVAHIWFLKSLPSRIGLMLDMTLRDIERVLYFEVLRRHRPGMTPLERGQLLTEDVPRAGRPKRRRVRRRMGAEAIRSCCCDHRHHGRDPAHAREMPRTNSRLKIKKIAKRLKLLEASLQDPGNRRSG